MKLRNIFSFCFIVCTLALSALLFCFPASAKNIDVSSNESFSKALDEAVEGDVINVNSQVVLSKNINKNITINASENNIIIQGNITIENVTINGRTRVLKGNKLTIGDQAVLSYSKDLSNTLNINEGTAVLSGGNILFHGHIGSAVSMTKGRLEILSGRITTSGEGVEGISLYAGDLTMSGGEIITDGRFCHGIIAGNHEREGSNVTITGGSIVAKGEDSRGLSIHNSSNLIMTNGTVYGHKEALYVVDASATVKHPAKLRSVNLQKVSSERAKVNIDPVCEYYNPDSNAVSSLKMDIIADDIITLDIDDIANKDLFYFDIPDITYQFTDIQIYDNLDENNAVAYAEISESQLHNGKPHSINFFDDEGVTEFNIDIKLFYNNKLEEKQIKVVLFQKEFAGFRIEPDVIVGEWNQTHYSRVYRKVDVYAGCKSINISLPEGINNNRIESFEILDEKVTKFPYETQVTNVPYKKLGNNKYKVDLSTSAISVRPAIKTKITFKDGHTREDIIIFNRLAFTQDRQKINDNSENIVVSYTSHESFPLKDPHLIVVYNHSNRNFDRVILDIKTFELSKYTPDKDGVYKITIYEGLNKDDYSPGTPNGATIYLIEGDIDFYDEAFGGEFLFNRNDTDWINCRYHISSGLGLSEVGNPQEIKIDSIEYNEKNMNLNIKGDAACDKVIIQVWSKTENPKMLILCIDTVYYSGFDAIIKTSGLEPGNYIVKVSHYYGGPYVEKDVVIESSESITQRTFNDIANSYAKTQIKVLSSRGFYSWIEGDSFNPTRDITRAEFIYLVMKAVNLNTYFDDNFNDVKETDYYYQAIGTAKKLGITKGVGNNNFGVNQRITRQDMSTILVNALKVAEVSLPKGDEEWLERFTDKDKIAAYAKNSLAILVEEYILVGHNQILDPDGSFSMQQAAVVIYKIYIE